MNQPAIAGLILSAGASRRMGSAKALLAFRGETFLDRMIEILGSACDLIIVVLGYESEHIRAGLRRAEEAAFVVNPAPERGMLSSLQTGLSAIPEHAEAIVFTPVDYPEIEADTVRALVKAFRECRKPVTRPTYLGQHGHPVCVSRSVADEIISLPVSAQARDVIRGYCNQTCFVDVNDPGIGRDVDTREQYDFLLCNRA